MTESPPRKLLTAVFALWLILAPILCLYVISLLVPVYLDTGWERFMQAGIAAAFAGAAILLSRRKSFPKRLLRFGLYTLIVGAVLPFVGMFIICAFIARSCP
jgi:hypothetical protein